MHKEGKCHIHSNFHLTKLTVVIQEWWTYGEKLKHEYREFELSVEI